MKLLTRSNLMVGFLVIITLCIIGWGGVAFAVDFSLGIEARKLGMSITDGDGETSGVNSFGGVDIPYYDVYDLPDAKLEAELALLSFGINFERVSLVLKAGVVDAELNDFNDDSGRDYDVKFDGESDVAGGIGLRVRLFEIVGFNFIGNAEYLKYKFDNKIMVDGRDYSLDVFPGNSREYSSEMDVAQLEINLTAGKTFGWITPYIGIGYADFKIDVDLDERRTYSGGTIDISDSHYQWENEDKVGFLIGAGVGFTENFGMNLDIKSFGGETSGSVGVVYRF